MRKSLMPARTLKASSERHKLELRIDNAIDLKRQTLLNVRQGPAPVEQLKLWVNQQEVQSFLTDSSLLTQSMPDMVVNLCAYLQAGTNLIEAEVIGAPVASVQLSIDGFMLPVNIRNSFPSEENPMVLPGTDTSKIYIKFLEGMKVRLDPARPLADQLVESSGISLYPLQRVLQQNKVQKIELTFSGTPEQNDEMEKKAEANGTEQPNRNLMYRLILTKNLSIDEVRTLARVLYGMPFFEGVGLENSQNTVTASHAD